MMEEEWAESEEEAEVQVLVLSPRCWAVSSLCFLDEPTKHFPAELCSYLNQFSQFYSHSESHKATKHGGKTWSLTAVFLIKVENMTEHVSNSSFSL